MEFVYKCENCGACCRFWNPAHYDANIVDEHGNCIYLDLNTNKCTIYAERPMFCRVNEWYYAQPEINQNQSYEDYIFQQKIGCDILIRMKEIEDEVLSFGSLANGNSQES